MGQTVVAWVGAVIGIVIWGYSFIMPRDGRIAPRVIRYSGGLVIVFTGILYFAWPAIHFP